MFVGGLNNLGLFPGAPAATQENSAGNGEASFADVLGQAQPQTQSQPQATQAQVPQVNARASQNQAQASSLPTPTPPNFEAPLITDRLITQPSPSPIDALNYAAPVKSDEVVDSLTRRVVWTDFLRKMKDDLGLNAEDILNAFTSLSEEELAKPPQETVDKVVMAMGLDPQQSLLAKQYFQELIAKTKPRSLGEELSTSSRQINLTLMSQQELSRKSAEQSLNRMNQSFFMQSQPTSQVQSTNFQTEKNLEQVNQSAQSFFSNDVKAAPVAAQPMKQILDQMQPVNGDQQIELPPMQPSINNLEATKAAVPNVQGVFAGAMRLNTTPAAESKDQDFFAPAPKTEAAKPNPLGTELMSQVLAESDVDSEEFTSDASFLGAPFAAELQNSSTTEIQRNDFAEALGAVAPKEMPVPELIQQARVMVHEGGGEMKVTLNPEGLGEVAMRVNVENGKVNVQMVTESGEAKKLIERELHELKSQLAANNLQVDTIKVDTSTDIGKQLQQQYDDGQRQLAQQNLEQFRRDHQGWRRSFFEIPQVRAYKGQAEAPRDVQAPGAPRKDGRRLNLVA